MTTAPNLPARAVPAWEHSEGDEASRKKLIRRKLAGPTMRAEPTGHDERIAAHTVRVSRELERLGLQ